MRHVVELNLVECVTYPCCKLLSFPWRFCCFLKRIGWSSPTIGRLLNVASLFQTHIWRFFYPIFPWKIQDIWRPEDSFSTPEPSVSWSVMSARTPSWDENASSLRHADLFLGGTRLPPEVISARLNFRHAGRKICFYAAKIKRAVPYIAGPRAKFRSAVHKMNVV